MEGLRDIKDIVEVHEYSLETLIAVTLLALIALGTALYLFKNRRRRRKKLTPKQEALERLKKLDYSNVKEVVYTFIQEAEMFLNPKNKIEYGIIEKELTPFKYKKEIPQLDEKLQARIQQFIKELK